MCSLDLEDFDAFNDVMTTETSRPLRVGSDNHSSQPLLFDFQYVTIIFKIENNIPSNSDQFCQSSLPTITRTMATGAASNEDSKINKLFDVSNFSAVVTRGGTGIGLMITQTLVANGAKVYITKKEEI